MIFAAFVLFVHMHIPHVCTCGVCKVGYLKGGGADVINCDSDFRYTARAMQVGTASWDPNPNARWLNSRGMWAGYLTSVAILHLLLMSIPWLSTAMAWTLTHVIHNVVSLRRGQCVKTTVVSAVLVGEGSF